MIKLFTSSFIQVGLVATNTYLISKGEFAGIFVCSFFISLTWTWNVKKVAFGSLTDRIVYALGAAVGALSSVYLIKQLI